MSRLDKEAYEFTSSYQNLAHFSHSLEVLLHSVLENSDGKSDLQLESAIKLVKKFPQALQVIVNCARKSEMTLWRSFFDVASDPKLLYQESIDMGDFQTATSYLIIIQTLESSKVSAELATKLFECALQSNDFETASELYRFLRKIDELEREEDSYRLEEWARNGEESAISPLKSPYDCAYMLRYEQSIHQKASVILKSQSFRELLKFSILFCINLQQFLKEARPSTMMLIVDWNHTFTLLHEQFNWGWPISQGTTSTTTPLVRRQSSRNFEDLGEHQVDIHYRGRSKPVSSKLAKHRKQDELLHLLKSSLLGEFWELALMISTMLFKQTDVLYILKQNGGMIDKWDACTRGNSVYYNFCNRIRGLLNEQFAIN